jgi:hypothetical protein
MFLRNPLVGGGPGADFAQHLSSHSDLLFLLSNYGFPGLLLFLVFTWRRFLESSALRDPLLRVVAVGVTVFSIVVGVAHTTLLHRPYAVGVGILASMVALGLCTKSGVRPPLRPAQASDTSLTQRTRPTATLSAGLPRIGE